MIVPVGPAGEPAPVRVATHGRPETAVEGHRYLRGPPALREGRSRRPYTVVEDGRTVGTPVVERMPEVRRILGRTRTGSALAQDLDQPGDAVGGQGLAHPGLQRAAGGVHQGHVAEGAGQHGVHPGP